MNKIIFCILFFAAPALYAQGLYTSATIYDGNGKTIKNGAILVNPKGEIVAAETQLSPQKANLSYDYSGKIITPGFIDVGSVLGLTEIWAVKASTQTSAGNLDRPADYIQAGFRAADGFNPNAVAIPITRSGGVSSVVTNPSGRLISGQSAWVDLAPTKNFESQIADPSVAIHVSLNSGSAGSVGGSTAGVVLLLKEAFDDAKYLLQNKKELDGSRAKQSALSRQDVLALQKGLEKKIPVIFSVSRAVDIRAAMALAKSYSFQLIISGGEEAWMVADELAEAKVPVIVDPYKNLPSNFDKLGTRVDNIVLLHKAKVDIMISTFDSHNVRNLRFAAGNAVRAGLPYEAALAAITSTPAKYFGAKKLGILEKGKDANFVVWSGDPFEPSTSVEAMFIKGKKVSLDNRQEALFRKYRKLKRRGVVPEKK